MKKTTPIYALGIILLFLGLSINPITAQNISTDTITVTYVNEDNSVTYETLTLTEVEIQELNQILDSLIEKIQSAPDYATAVSLIEECMKGKIKNPGLKNLASAIVKMMFRSSGLYPTSPFRQNVMILSSGYTNKPFSLRETHIYMHRALTFWFYSVNSNILINSKTIIVDPYPFGIKTLTGRQFGMMRGFTGIYITQHSNVASKDYTYFMGHARNAIGYDLSL